MPVGRKWPRRAPRGDFSAACHVCGVVWRRSQLERKADGHLYCPDDAEGRDAVTLNEANAAAARALNRIGPRQEGGTLPNDVTPAPAELATVVGRVTFGNGGGH